LIAHFPSLHASNFFVPFWFTRDFYLVFSYMISRSDLGHREESQKLREIGLMKFKKKFSEKETIVKDIPPR